MLSEVWTALGDEKPILQPRYLLQERTRRDHGGTVAGKNAAGMARMVMGGDGGGRDGYGMEAGLATNYSDNEEDMDWMSFMQPVAFSEFYGGFNP